MEDANVEDKQSSSRYRSPSFSKDEVDLLLSLIEKYKLYILNKSNTGTACQVKDEAWRRIQKQFNCQFLGNARGVASLRGKWENLKRDARKVSKNVLECNDPASARILAMLSEADNIGAVDNPRESFDMENCSNENGIENHKDIDTNFSKQWDGNGDSDEEYHPKSKRTARSLNFSPQECSLLLQCVRQEKKQVFSKECTKKAIDLKNSAWMRIAESYNKLSPEKRSAKALQTKFKNLKKLAKKTRFKDYFKRVNIKHNAGKFIEEKFKSIKKEPLFEDADSDVYEDVDDTDYNCNGNDNDAEGVDVPPDPLNAVLNSDSGIGSSNIGSWNWRHSENKEVDRLKIELLNYQLETAKLERKRIEDAIQEGALAREARATETALRLRAARLEAAAAEMRLPPAHPALCFTPEETRAQHYLNQYHQT